MNLVQANKSHIRDIWYFRNDPISREMCFNSEEISWRDHKDWFEKNSLNKDMVIYVAEVDKVNLGYIRFDNTFLYPEKYSISIILSPKYRGLGYGRLLLRNGIIKFWDQRKNINKVIAIVKKKNINSIKLFLKENFKVEKETDSEIEYYLKRI